MRPSDLPGSSTVSGNVANRDGPPIPDRNQPELPSLLLPESIVADPAPSPGNKSVNMGMTDNSEVPVTQNDISNPTPIEKSPRVKLNIDPRSLSIESGDIVYQEPPLLMRDSMTQLDFRSALLKSMIDRRNRIMNNRQSRSNLIIYGI